MTYATLASMVSPSTYRFNFFPDKRKATAAAAMNPNTNTTTAATAAFGATEAAAMPSSCVPALFIPTCSSQTATRVDAAQGGRPSKRLQTELDKTGEDRQENNGSDKQNET
ncbi:hypothetical protein BBJ28_00023136 [Nothophytophthora sp. Chile5]|nr:hypothetical protein BBJ28_00023136 [Nothophytophthora sp. Chile5]